ncbi:MAG: UDP-glucose--hexose-1-phosphate uridylyltransferase [Lachnospiraceae bacterium]|nr:UDP-glucose--hexose-1-phosphate uridylyltransferase [Lachnospiraceae bacterium]
MSKLCENIAALVQYGLDCGLIEQDEKIYATNLLLDIYNEEDYEESAQSDETATAPGVYKLEQILKNLLDIAVERELIPDSIVYRDLFDTRLMNAITPRPSEVNRMFYEKYNRSPEEATDFYYKFSQDTDYIRRYRLCKDMRWTVDSMYGEIDLSINLSKPEKDPKAIAAAKNAKQSGYPKCQLCVENVGYAGRVNHPARQTHRVIPITINESAWSFQYSPYGYYNEHCIVLNNEHVPMKIERATFVKLFDFVKLFPHYFLGSNADLPIVGGSILSHDHYQGGRYDFAMAKTDFEECFTIPGYEDITAGIVKWPMSVIRLQGSDANRVIDLAEHILNCWKSYTDEAAYIFAETDGIPHNTITPIARMRREKYELDLVLRNNITTKECPLGLYHPHDELHHIKKENIGLIEVMGLAVLPARLNTELADLAQAILKKEDIRGVESLAKHADWVEEFLPRYENVTEENVMDILKSEVGKVFVKVLEDAGVYKCTPEGRQAFGRFIHVL